MLHLRYLLDGADYELQTGYYVLRKVLSFSEKGGISFGVVPHAGEDEYGSLVADAETVILPRHLLEQFVGIGLQARQLFIEKIG